MDYDVNKVGDIKVKSQINSRHLGLWLYLNNSFRHIVALSK